MGRLKTWQAIWSQESPTLPAVSVASRATSNGLPRSVGWQTCGTPRSWRTTISCRPFRMSPTTWVTRWRCPESRPRRPKTPALTPHQRAGCSLADSITPEDLQAWKDEHPGAVVVPYVNTTAAVKALTDICCTSSNAVDVVASIDPDREVLFCPDQFLGAHVRRVTGRDNLHVWAGECHVHAGINGDELADQARKHPDAELFVHPECGCATSALYLAGEGAFPPDRVKILSTGGMLEAAHQTRARKVLVATEVGMLYQLRRAAPEVDFRAVNDRASCKYMKMITPAALLRCLVEGADEVHVDAQTAQRARQSVQRMIAIGQPGGDE